MNALDSIPRGTWRLFQATFNVVILTLLIFGIWNGSRQRGVLKSNQEIIISKQGRVDSNMIIIDTFVNNNINN